MLKLITWVPVNRVNNMLGSASARLAASAPYWAHNWAGATLCPVFFCKQMSAVLLLKVTVCLCLFIGNSRSLPSLLQASAWRAQTPQLIPAAGAAVRALPRTWRG